MGDHSEIHPGFLSAVEFFGTPAAVARAAGVTPQYVGQCKRSGFSAGTALALERASGGVLRAIDLARNDGARRNRAHAVSLIHAG